jgi:hypothetical protein
LNDERLSAAHTLCEGDQIGIGGSQFAAVARQGNATRWNLTIGVWLQIRQSDTRLTRLAFQSPVVSAQQES